MSEPVYRIHAWCPRCRHFIAYRIPGWVMDFYQSIEPDRWAGSYQCARPSCRERGPDGKMRRTIIDLFAVNFQQAQPAEEPLAA